MCLPLPNPLAQMSFCTLTSDPWEQPTRKWIVLKGIDWFVVYRWLFISFHTGGLTSGDPSVDQSTESHDLYPFATALISFDGPWFFFFWCQGCKMKPCGALIEERRGAATPPRAYHFLSPNVKHIKLNVPANLTQLFVCCWGVCARVCLCEFLLALNGVHMSVYVQLSEHTQACWCLHVRGGDEVGETEFHWHVHVGWGYTSCNTLQRDEGTCF